MLEKTFYFSVSRSIYRIFGARINGGDFVLLLRPNLLNFRAPHYIAEDCR